MSFRHQTFAQPVTSAGCILFALVIIAGTAAAQQPTRQTASPQALPQQTIGHIDISATAEKIQVSGAVTLSGSSTLLGNGSTLTAGANTLAVHLTRGGELDLCATTQLHLSQENNPSDPDRPFSDPNSPLMLALDRGAVEAHYTIGKNSDVVLTPDLRILLSGPGKADVRIRVNAQGDTCVDNRIDNRGANAPYITVSEQMGPGVYRVQPDQRVMFEHGSVRDVVDHETQPCGCPANPVTPTISIASAGIPVKQSGANAARPGDAVAAETPAPGGPSSTPADTAFPLAESEGLAAPPGPPTKPVAPPGVIHSEVTSTLSYVAPTQTVPTGAPNGMATPESAATIATQPEPGFGPAVSSVPITSAQAPPEVPAAKPTPHKSGIFHKIGRFFKRIFG